MRVPSLRTGALNALLLTAVFATTAHALPATMSAMPRPAGRSAWSERSTPQPPVARVTRPRSERPLVATSLDGTWREYGLLQVSSHASFYDAGSDRLFALGGTRDQTWSLTLGTTAGWSVYSPARIGGGGQYGRSVAFDPAARTAYVSARGDTGLEVWSIDVATGTPAAPLATSGDTPGVWDASLAYDATRHRLLAVGGFDRASGFQLTSDVWALDLTGPPTWSLLSPTGDAPNARAGSAVVVDAAQDRLLVLGGYGSSAIGDSIWALSLSGTPHWMLVGTLPPAAGSDMLSHGVVLDAAAGRLLVLDADLDLWAFTLATNQWDLVPIAAPGPAARVRGAIALDATRHRLLLTGGMTPLGATTSDTWALTLDGPPTWTSLVAEPVRPPLRGGASDGFDASRNRMVVFGGSDELGGFRNDTWALDLTGDPTWASVGTAGTPPEGRYWHSSAYDPVRDQLVVYGGYTGDSNAPLGDVWALSFAAGTPTWTPIVPAGPGPLARFLSTLVYDSTRDRFLLLFGTAGPSLLGDVWELRLAPTPAWRRLLPDGTAPVTRGAAMAAYDPDGDRVIVFGGGNENSMLADTWALELSAGDGHWQPLAVTGPSARNLGLLRFDSNRGRVLLFGGYGVIHEEPGFIEIAWLDDTWALNLQGSPAWAALNPVGVPPSARDRADGTFDAVRDRLVVACGGGNGSNDYFTLTFGDLSTPTQIALASFDARPDRVSLRWSSSDPGMQATLFRREALAAWDAIATVSADGEGMLGWEDRTVTPGATYEYRLGIAKAGGMQYVGMATVRVPFPGASLALAGRANGARLAFTVTLVSSEPATLALYDVSGRRLWSRDVGALGAGTHHVIAGDGALRAGLYFARLTQSGAVRTARGVVAE